MIAVAPPRYVVHHADAIEYQPMFIDGEQVGEAHQLRNGGIFTGDESFYVLEGSVSIELVDTGERVELNQGRRHRLIPQGHTVGLDFQRTIQEVHGHLELTGRVFAARGYLQWSR